MEILSEENGFVLFVDLRVKINSRTRHFWFARCHVDKKKNTDKP